MKLNSIATFVRLAVVASVAASLTPQAEAQAGFWNQPWNPATKRAAYPSTVTAPGGLAMPTVCRDDMNMEAGTSVKALDWWGTEDGTVSRFVIASFCNKNCNVKGKITQETLTPTKVFAGIDCQGKTVWKYSVTLTVPIPYVAGFNGRTWVSIAEDDSTSSMVGVSQFSWSGYRPVRFCPAQAWNNTFNVGIVDACDGKANDLAFVAHI